MKIAFAIVVRLRVRQLVRLTKQNYVVKPMKKAQHFSAVYFIFLLFVQHFPLSGVASLYTVVHCYRVRLRTIKCCMIVGGVGGSCGFARRMWTSRNDESLFSKRQISFFFPPFFLLILVRTGSQVILHTTNSHLIAWRHSKVESSKT